jgi:hypothetical protein
VRAWRLEQRTLRVAKAPPDLGWPYDRQILSLKRYVVHTRTGELVSNQTVFAVTSLRPDQATPVELLRLASALADRELVLGSAMQFSAKPLHDGPHMHTRSWQVLAAFRNLVISLIHLGRGRHITATRECCARYPNVLLHYLQLRPPGE